MNTDGHNKKWNPFLGREISEMTIGLFGFGRIAKLLAELLQPFNCKIISYDIEWDFNNVKDEWVNNTDFIFSNSFDHTDKQEECLDAWMS